LKARYYDPKIGRFLQPDPIGYSDSLNLYQFAINNPLNGGDTRGGSGSGYMAPDRRLVGLPT